MGDTIRQRITETAQTFDAALEAGRAAFADIPLPELVTDAATLEDMLAEGRVIRKRGVVFVALPPTVAELPGLLRAVEATQTGEVDAAEWNVQMARRLLRVRDGETLRAATVEEITACWSGKALTAICSDTLTETGLQQGEPGN